MRTGRNKELLVLVGVTAVLLWGCGKPVNTTVMDEGTLQQGNKQIGAYVTIQEDEVPLAAVPQMQEEMAEASEAPMEDATPEKIAETPEKIAETSEEIAETPDVPEILEVPETEVEVSLYTEDAQVEVEVDEEAEASNYETDFVSDLQQAVNDARAAAGLPGLVTSPELSAAAAQRAKELTQSFSHTRPDGKDYHTAVTEAGGSFGSIGENLFYGTQTVTEVQNAWNGSQIHLDNILYDGFSHIGIGVAKTADNVYVVQIFTD